MDSDTTVSNKTKARIIKEFEDKKMGSSIWRSKGREIENYLSAQMIEGFSGTKELLPKKKKYMNVTHVVEDYEVTNYGNWNKIWILTAHLKNGKSIIHKSNKIDLAKYIISTKPNFDDFNFQYDLNNQIIKITKIIQKWNK